MTTKHAHAFTSGHAITAQIDAEGAIEFEWLSQPPGHLWPMVASEYTLWLFGVVQAAANRAGRATEFDCPLLGATICARPFRS